jgi:DNA-binding CsgD family transcriptional regulator
VSRLLYGEWLRRERRRTEAREQLRTAYELFTEFGMEAFAERARIELKATGETARKRTVDPGGQLTAQETQIARLARDGLSNPAIASQLFISPRTVEYHLSKVFAKLNISAREQLDRVLPQDPNAAQRAYWSLSSVSKACRSGRSGGRRRVIRGRRPASFPCGAILWLASRSPSRTALADHRAGQRSAACSTETTARLGRRDAACQSGLLAVQP